MNNQDNNVIRPNFGNNSSGGQEKNIKPNSGKPKKNNKVLIIAIVVVIILFGGYYLLFGKTSGGIIGKKDSSKDEKITFDTEYDWANKYGLYIQDYFEKLDKFDIALVDLNKDSTPELVINYLDNSERKTTDIIYIKNKKVNKTRAYNSASLCLITPINLNEVLWYLYIGNNTYGKYTIASQLIDGTALDATIKATNNTEVTNYKNNYLRSDFELTFYEVEKKTFKDDYLTKVNRYNEDKEKINEEISNLQKEREKYIIDNGIDTTKDKTIKLHSYTLEVGEYTGTLYATNNGETTTSTDTLTINTLNTLTYQNKELKFTVAGDTITCDDGTVFTAVGNNQIQIVDKDKGPITYKIPAKTDDKKNSN